MKRSSYFTFIALLALLFLSLSSGEKMKEVDQSGRCIAVMDPSGCNLQSCKQHCLQSKNGNGLCIANVKEGYRCVCYFNC